MSLERMRLNILIGLNLLAGVNVRVPCISVLTCLQVTFPMQLGEAEGWLREEDGKQKKLKAYDNPRLLSSAIDERIETLRKPFTRLKNKKKPKPPPAPKSDGKANETESEDAASKSDLVDDEAPLEEEPHLDGEEGDLSGVMQNLVLQSCRLVIWGFLHSLTRLSEANQIVRRLQPMTLTARFEVLALHVQVLHLRIQPLLTRMNCDGGA